MISVIKKYWLLVVLIIIGMIFRLYQAPQRMLFNLDGDLYSWIVNDIVVNHHLRLIGQLTSTPGIFIGPLFYYLLIPFFLLTHMDPIGGLYFSALLSLVTMVSTYYVFQRHFDKTTALIAVALDAVLMTRIHTDMWVVPTITQYLWSVWYLWVLLELLKGRFKSLFILALLISLIWHINFSLAPILAAVPVAILLSKKWPSLKEIMISGVVLVLTSLPLFIFEARHHFSQTISFVNSFQGNQLGGTGLKKLWHILFELGNNFFHGQVYRFDYELSASQFLIIGLLVLGSLLLLTKWMHKKVYIVLMVWVVSIVGFFTISSKIISEYYFENLTIVFLTIIILTFRFLYQNKWWRILVFLSLLIVSYWSADYILTGQDTPPDGFLAKQALVQFIGQDMQNKHYDCATVSYIVREGDILGITYLMHHQGIDYRVNDKNAPAYNVVYPLALAPEAANHRFGALGVIVPDKSVTTAQLNNYCHDHAVDPTRDLFGYTE